MMVSTYCTCLLNDELNVLVLEGGTLTGPALRPVTRRTTENASCCISLFSDVDEAVLSIRQRGLVGSHIGTVVVEMEDII